ncbi:hypothetical protein H1C71_039751, partial [Ictidomys tridecemlineatus]
EGHACSPSHSRVTRGSGVGAWAILQDPVWGGGPLLVEEKGEPPNRPQTLCWTSLVFSVGEQVASLIYPSFLSSPSSTQGGWGCSVQQQWETASAAEAAVTTAFWEFVDRSRVAAAHSPAPQLRDKLYPCREELRQRRAAVGHGAPVSGLCEKTLEMATLLKEGTMILEPITGGSQVGTPDHLF